MRQKKTMIALVVLLMSLGVVSYWDEFKTAKEERQEKEKNRPLQFMVEDVREFLFESHDGDSTTKVALIKSEGEWRFKEDLQLKANGSTVEGILKTLSDYKFQRELDVNRAKEYGLTEPRRSIAFLTRDGQRFAIDVGDNTPVGYYVYFSVNGDNVYSGPQYLVQSTARKAIDFRDRKLADFSSDAVESVDYNVGGAKLLKLVREDGLFKLITRSSMSADQAVVEDFFDSIKNAEVKEFIDDAGKDFVKNYFSANDRVEITLHIKGENPIELEMAEVDNRFWVRKPDGSFGLLPDHYVRKLVKRVIDFRDRRILQIEAGEVNKLKINKKTFLRVGGDFFESEPGSSRRIKVGQVYNFLMDLVYGKAEDIFSARRKSVRTLTRSRPVYNIELSTNAGPTVIRAWQSLADQNAYILKISSNTNEVYKVKKKLFTSAKANK